MVIRNIKRPSCGQLTSQKMLNYTHYTQRRGPGAPSICSLSPYVYTLTYTRSLSFSLSHSLSPRESENPASHCPKSFEYWRFKIFSCQAKIARCLSLKFSTEGIHIKENILYV